MDPITLHFRVLQVGANTEGRQSLQVNDPHGVTVGKLKRQLFEEAIEEHRSVRFITGGRILEDTQRLEQCGLGSEAFIHVSIGGSSSLRASPIPTLPGSTAEPDADSGFTGKGASDRDRNEDNYIGPCFLVGAAFFAGTGVLLRMAWHKRWTLSMHASQFLCILAAVWVYLLLCHGLPAIFQSLVPGLRTISRVVSGSDRPEAATDAARCTTAPGTAEQTGVRRCPTAAAGAETSSGAHQRCTNTAPKSTLLPEGHMAAQMRPLAGVTTPGGSSSSWS
mmetsp:Transcript_125121/g.348176  ORF Transcript_125121/g.348176 Transcript_125121/m.348176 type:complete len:278 (-) Transcript_125121:87-920(-)